MKKLVTVLSAIAVALALTNPVFAKKHEKKSTETASSASQSKAHMKHAKKKGGTEGKKQGQ